MGEWRWIAGAGRRQQSRPIGGGANGRPWKGDSALQSRFHVMIAFPPFNLETDFHNPIYHGSLLRLPFPIRSGRGRFRFAYSWYGYDWLTSGCILKPSILFWFWFCFLSFMLLFLFLFPFHFQLLFNFFPSCYSFSSSSFKWLPLLRSLLVSVRDLISSLISRNSF